MKKIIAPLAVLALGAVVLTGCASSADKVNENLSTSADNFEVQRRIIGVNGFDSSYLFEVEGRCSLTDQGTQLEVICKHGENDYRKHMIRNSDNMTYVATQLDPIDVSEYHTRIIIKPQNLLPDFDLQVN